MADYYSGQGAAIGDGPYDTTFANEAAKFGSAMPSQAAMPTQGAMKTSSRHHFELLTRPKNNSLGSAAGCQAVKTGSSMQTPEAVKEGTQALKTAAALQTNCNSPDCDGSGYDYDANDETAFSYGAMATGCPYVIFPPGPTGHGDEFVNRIMMAPGCDQPPDVRFQDDKATQALNAQLVRQCATLKGLTLINPGHALHSFERVFTFRWSSVDAGEAAKAGRPYRCCLPIFTEKGGCFPSVRDIVGAGLGRGACGIGSNLSVMHSHEKPLMREHVLDRLVAMALDYSVPSSHAILASAEIVEFENDGSCPALLYISGVRQQTITDADVVCAAYISAETRALVSMPLRVVQSAVSDEKYATFSTMNPDAEARHTLESCADQVQKDKFYFNTNMTYFLRSRMDSSPNWSQAAAELLARGVIVNQGTELFTGTATGVEYVRCQMHEHQRGISMLPVSGDDRAVAEIVLDGVPSTETVKVQVRVRFAVRYPRIMGSLIDLLGMKLQETQQAQQAQQAAAEQLRSAAGGGAKKKKKKKGAV